MKANLNQLRYKATLNQQGYKTLANGNTIPANVALFDFRFGYYHMSLQTNIQANVLNQLIDTVTIFARHNDSFIGDSLSITIDGVSYNINSVIPDFDVNGLDTITLKKVGA